MLIAFGPHKSAQSAYFVLEGVEKDGLQHGASRKISSDFSPRVLIMENGQRVTNEAKRCLSLPLYE